MLEDLSCTGSQYLIQGCVCIIELRQKSGKINHCSCLVTLLSFLSILMVTLVGEV